MKAEEILKSDVLDILFEDRNKNYGAYELRRNYAGRLQKALGICASLLLVVLTTGFVMAKNSKIEKPLEVYTEVDLQAQKKEEKIEIEQPKPRPVEQQVATVANVIPLIVPDDQADKDVPTVDDMEDKQIAIDTHEGKPSDDIVQAPTNDAVGGGDEEIVKPKKEVYEETYRRVEIMPSYPGGNEALIRFLLKNLRSPADLDENQTVKVVMQFVVAKDGSISALTVTESGGAAFDKEVERVMKMMPNWIPGEQNGHPVAVYFNLPVTFSTQAE
jgi:periplasmic protein TonB